MILLARIHGCEGRGKLLITLSGEEDTVVAPNLINWIRAPPPSLSLDQALSLPLSLLSPPLPYTSNLLLKCVQTNQEPACRAEVFLSSLPLPVPKRSSYQRNTQPKNCIQSPLLTWEVLVFTGTFVCFSSS